MSGDPLEEIQRVRLPQLEVQTPDPFGSFQPILAIPGSFPEDENQQVELDAQCYALRSNGSDRGTNHGKLVQHELLSQFLGQNILEYRVRGAVRQIKFTYEIHKSSHLPRVGLEEPTRAINGWTFARLFSLCRLHVKS